MRNDSEVYERYESTGVDGDLELWTRTAGTRRMECETNEAVLDGVDERK